jgi:hypothetical protein
VPRSLIVIDVGFVKVIPPHAEAYSSALLKMGELVVPAASTVPEDSSVAV